MLITYCGVLVQIPKECPACFIGDFHFKWLILADEYQLLSWLLNCIILQKDFIFIQNIAIRFMLKSINDEAIITGNFSEINRCITCKDGAQRGESM
jgi:hypothetical protein